MAPKQDIVLNHEQAKEIQAAFIEAYSQPEFQQKLHRAFKNTGGDPMKETIARSEICLPIQAPLVGKYGFTPDQKGVSASLRAFRKPELQTEDILQQSQELSFLVTPSLQNMEWVEKMAITESPLLKDAPAPKTEPAPVPASASTPVATLTHEQAREMQDSFEQAYSTPEFQQKLHKALLDATGDPVKEMAARQQVCLPVQTPIVAKYGFTPDQKGVSASVRQFQKNPELQTEELIAQGQRLFVLVNPSFQTMDWVTQMGITESPLLQGAATPGPTAVPASTPEPEPAPPPEPQIELTVEQAREFQASLIEAYSKPEFQAKLHGAFTRLGGDPSEETKARADCCLPIQVPVVSKYGFTPDKKGVAASVRAFNNPELLADEQLSAQQAQLSVLVNPNKQELSWVQTLGVTESPLFRDPVSIFSLVEIVGLAAPVEPSPAVLEIKPDMQAVRVNGHKGWTVAWVEAENGFLVRTLGGDYVCLSEEYLRVYIPPYPENGGFDLAWPIEEHNVVISFTLRVADALKSKGFCVVQMFSSEAQKAGLLAETDELTEWTVIAPEFQEMFMGRNRAGKVSWLRGDESEDPDSWIGDADASLGRVADLIGPHCPEFGFNAGGRSKTMLRNLDPADPQGDAVLAVRMDSVINGDEVGNLLKFVNQSKIGMILTLCGGGGFFTVDYLDTDTPSVNIPIQDGQLVLISHEHATFAYNPNSKCLSLQSWILREQLPGEVSTRPDLGLEAWDASRFPQGPAYGASGETVDVMALAALTNGDCETANHYWTMLQHGTDCPIAVPKQRWDSDIYYHPESQPGKMYVNHFGHITRFDQFDNQFFGLTDEEAFHFMDPVVRKSIESAYRCFTLAGYDKKSLQGSDIMVSLGYAGTDYGGIYRWSGKATVEGLEQMQIAHCANRLSFILGLRGPVLQCDTACSSSLTATGQAHSYMRPQEPNSYWTPTPRQATTAIVGGINGIFEPSYPIALCGAGMLTHAGRCFTFDQSADGFARGDGCSFMYYEVHQKEMPTRFAMLAGTCLNQDGRSASLTAPNGPSQQECIRHSLREADITVLDIHMQELHGTGTSLGDPIEVGALRATMMKNAGKVREHPLVNTSSKSNLSHTEGNAGLSGIMKCVLMGCHGVAAPGVHLRLLNAHIEYANYPVIFNPEVVDQRSDWGYVGVSSFGFSGCNARGDVYAACTMGFRSTLPLGNGFTYERHLMMMPEHEPAVSYGPLLKRKEEDVYVTNTWSGLFQSGNPLHAGTSFQISGSWSSFTEMEPMLLNEGVYSYGFKMGDTLVEEFKIHTDYFSDSIICPATKKAGKDAIILGPGTAPQGYTWRIDGRSEGAEPGDLYMVSFWWDEHSKQKKVDWKIFRGEQRAQVESLIDIPEYEHTYSVKSTWSAWTCIELSPVLALGYIHETTFRIGQNGFEEFYIVRDFSEQQQIYPASQTEKNTKVGVRGPDSNRKDRIWRVRGETGDQITLRLRVRKGDISVSLVSSCFRERTWNRPAFGIDDDTYFLEGSWPEGCIAMQPVKSKPNVFTAQVRISERGCETFRILVDQEPEQAFYPEMAGAQSGQSAVLGPDHLGSDLHWNIYGEPFTAVQITLDLTKADKKQRVIWECVS